MIVEPLHPQCPPAVKKVFSNVLGVYVITSDEYLEWDNQALPIWKIRALREIDAIMNASGSKRPSEQTEGLEGYSDPEKPQCDHMWYYRSDDAAVTCIKCRIVIHDDN
jgi:hypothetical protein